MSELVWGLMGLGLLAYVLTGGADFGGGFWHLLARGPDRDEQRRAIDEALAPIWEANHVWIIFVIVCMFTAFPVGFAVIGTALHVPLSLALVGIVLRGAAFVFRAYGLKGAPGSSASGWGQVFAWSSTLTPIWLGVCLGAVAGGTIRLERGVVTSFVDGWATGFAFLVGLMALAAFALLAAAHLAADAAEPLRVGFAARARWAQVGLGALAVAAGAAAPALFKERFATWVGLLAVAGAVAAAAMAWRASRLGRQGWARRFIVAEVACVVAGFGGAMRGHVVLDAVPLAAAGTRPETLGALVPVLGIGGLLLAPSLWYLFRVFRRRL